jgi:DNA-binding SARP family transcriptional activator
MLPLAESAGRMEARVLGPLEVEDADGRRVDVTAMKPRRVLSLLLTNAGHPVTTTAIARELWDSEPPASCTTTIQTYIMQLRRMFCVALGAVPCEVAATVLVTRGNSYCLQLDARQLDLTQFDQKAKRGRELHTRGDFAGAAELLADALALWRGPMLADVETGAVLTNELACTEQSRLSVLEQRVDADLRLGRHRQMLGELTSLSNEHPLNETVQAQYMLALYRAGRTAEASLVFRALRDRLVDEVGLEPRREVQSLHEAILREDPLLAPPAARERAFLIEELAAKV